MFALGIALACNAPIPGLFGPTPIPVSTEAAGQLIENLGSITPGPDGSVTVVITQEQLTSFVAIELAKTPDVPLENPQIALDKGEVQFTGVLDTGGLKSKVEVSLSVVVNAEGKLDVQITTARLGPLPIPGEILEAVSQVVSDSLTNEINTKAGAKIKLTSVTIENGALTATGVAIP